MFIVNLLAAALVAFSASSAAAAVITMAGVVGQELNQGDRFEVSVTLDTDGTTGITLLSIGVLFDDTKLAYVKGATETFATSYMFYSAPTKGNPNNFLKASSTCGGYPSPGGYYTNSGDCSLRVNTTNQVNLDFVSADLAAGTSGNNTGVAQMANLVFEVLDTAEDGAAVVELSQTSPGNVIGQPGGGSTTATLLGGGVVNVPEPGVAGLSLAALLTVGGLRARSRMRS